MSRWIWALGLALALGQGTGTQQARAAQTPACDVRQKVVDHLAQKYNEATVAVGVTNGGGLVEVLSSGDGQTWTIVVSSPNGVTCLLATGEGWRPVQAEPVKLESKI